MGLFEIGMAGVAVLVVGWLIVSFTAPSPRRTLIEWISATAMYVALVCLFVNLCLQSWEKGNNIALVAFGFLAVLFGSGLLVSFYNACTAMSSHGKRDTPSATS